MSLKETNRAAFLALLQQDLESLLPLVYTPVIAQACLHWGTLIPRPLGLYVTPEDDPMDLIKHWPSQEVGQTRVILVTE
jgi:malate dehydrogenase (oxaloacetate-decarboxylating)(NADP+)